MWELVSYVNRGKIRRNVLRLLNEPATPTELSKKLNFHRASVSRALIDLESKKLAVYLTPNEAVYRYYKITKKGKEVLKQTKIYS